MSKKIITFGKKKMIKEIKILPKELRITFKNSKIDNFPNLWLRDHAKDEINWDYRSNQRKRNKGK